MSTRIFKALLPLAFVAACAGGNGQEATDTLSLSLRGSDLVLGAPPNYCFDPVSRDRNAVGLSVLLADCAILGVGEPQAPVYGAVLSATVMREDTPGDLAELERFLRSEPGRLAMGGGSDVVVLESLREDGVLYLKIRGDAGSALPTAPQDQWRGFFSLSDRLVSVSVTGFQGAAPSDERARGMIEAMATRSRTLSG